MGDSLLEEYKEYYSTRAERFNNKPNYPHSYAAEKALSEAMQSCNQLEEFKDRMGDLNIKCGIALIQDKYEMRKQHYSDMKETVRLSVTNDILENVSKAQTAMDIATVVSEIETKGGVKIAMDEANRQFHGEWNRLDSIEVYENAEVPSSYASIVKKWAAEEKEKLVEGNTWLEENNDAWQPGWRHTPAIVTEHRHRRLLPYNDEHITEQLTKYRTIINR